MRWLFHYDEWCNIGRVPLIYNTIDKVFELKRLFFSAIKIKYLSLSKWKNVTCHFVLIKVFTLKKKNNSERIPQRQSVEWVSDCSV